MRYRAEVLIPANTIETGIRAVIIENGKIVTKDAEFISDCQFEYLDSDILRIEMRGELVATEFSYLFETESGIKLIGLEVVIRQGSVFLAGEAFLEIYERDLNDCEDW